MELTRLWTIKAKKQRNKWYLKQFGEAFLYAGISLPPQQAKDELRAGINEEKNSYIVLLFFNINTKYFLWTSGELSPIFHRTR
jgi:hypothetical protein